MKFNEVGKNILLFDNKDVIVYNTANSSMYYSMKGLEETIKELSNNRMDNTTEATKKNSDIQMEEEIQTIVINCAEVCNLKCKYCYVSQGTYGSKHTIMSEKIYDALLGNLFKINPNGVKAFHFFGGEPLLGIEQIKAFCEKVSELYLEKGLTIPLFTMTTNATLLDEEIIKFLEKYKFKICISLDGPKTINDAGRISDNYISVYDVVVSKLEMLRGRNIDVCCEATLTESNLQNMKEEELRCYFEFFNKLPIKMVAILMAKENNHSKLEVYAESLQKFYSIYVEYVLEGLINGKRMILYSNITSGLAKIMNDVEYKICSAGSKQIFINAVGEVFPCQMYYSARYGKMGELDDVAEVVYSIDNHRKNGRKIKKCETCNFSKFCSVCPGINLFSDQNELIMDEEQCMDTKILITNLIWKIGKMAQDADKYQRFAVNLQKYYAENQEFVFNEC